MRKYPVQFLGLVALTASATLGAQTASPRYTVRGVVYDDASAPIPNARLSLSRDGEATRLLDAGADGKFSFESVAPGQVTLRARRLGYKVAELQVAVDATTSGKSYALQMTEVPSEVAEVIVEGSKGHLQEFYEHKANNNFAKFFERKDIEKQNPAFLSELLRSVAGASLSASPRSGNAITMRNCKPMVWVDGMRAPGAELDDVARPMDVAGLEVFPSNAGLPPQYQDRNNRMCGAILVWTRNQ